MSKKKIWVDTFTSSTYNEEHNEICCPNCGSWTNVNDLKQGDFDFVATCPLCREK